VNPKGIVFRWEGKCYVADVNAPIVDESGEPVASLKGWKLTLVGDGIAAFSDGSVDVPFRLPPD
jgi:hypothetical protein